MKPAPHVRANTSNDGLILLDIATGQIFSANPIAARIWNGLEQGLSLTDIVQRIVAETGADPEVVERDAAEFVNTLRLRALVAES
jgi:hypothetical protein